MELQWPLILFTFFLCLCGGVLGFQGLLTFLGKGAKMQKISLIVSLVALVVGGISVFTHLQHWERIFNGFSALIVGKGEYGISGIGLEMWGCVIFAIVVVLYFLFMQRSEEGVPPKWVAVLAIIVGVALPAVTGDSYLMAAIPAWNTPLLILFYIANTVVMGSLAALIIARVTESDDAYEFLSSIAFYSVIVETVLVIVYAALVSSMGAGWTEVSYYFDPTLPDVPMVNEEARTSILLGDKAIAFWVGAIIVGGVAPAALLWLSKKIQDAKKLLQVAIGSAALVAVGGIVWRCVLYMVAISAFALYSGATF